MKFLFLIILNMAFLPFVSASRLSTVNINEMKPTIALIITTSKATYATDIMRASRRILNYSKEKKIEITGLRYTSFKTDPEDMKKEKKWVVEVGYPIKKEFVQEKGEFQKRILPVGRYISIQFIGKKTLDDFLYEEFQATNQWALNNQSSLFDHTYQAYLSPLNGVTNELNVIYYRAIKEQADAKMEIGYESFKTTSPTIALNVETVSKEKASIFKTSLEKLQAYCKKNAIETVGSPYFRFKNIPINLSNDIWKLEIGIQTKTVVKKTTDMFITAEIPKGDYYQFKVNVPKVTTSNTIDEALISAINFFEERATYSGKAINFDNFFFKLLSPDINGAMNVYIEVNSY